MVDLSVGEPFHSPPRAAIVAAEASLRSGVGGYERRGGSPDLRAALSEKLRTRNQMSASPDQVTITSGASLGIFAALSALCEPGDTILLPDPGFPLYALMADVQRLRPARYSLDSRMDYEPDWTRLADLSASARVLIWNFPSNPTGTVPDSSWLPRLFDIVARNPQLHVISDEVYEDFVYTGTHLSPVVHAGRHVDRFVSIFSFSKTYAMTGWRVGYVHADRPLAAEVARRQWAAAMSTPTLAQEAALAALSASPDYVSETRDAVAANRSVAIASARRWRLPFHDPDGGFFLWIDVRETGMLSSEFVRRAAGEAGVLVNPGPDFGSTGEGFIRLNFAAAPTALHTGLARLGEWLAGAAVAGDKAASSLPVP